MIIVCSMKNYATNVRGKYTKIIVDTVIRSQFSSNQKTRQKSKLSYKRWIKEPEQKIIHLKEILRKGLKKEASTDFSILTGIIFF